MGSDLPNLLAQREVLDAAIRLAQKDLDRSRTEVLDAVRRLLGTARQLIAHFDLSKEHLTPSDRELLGLNPLDGASPRLVRSITAREIWRAKARAKTADLRVQGYTYTSWAREHGFPVGSVRQVLLGPAEPRKGVALQVGMVLGLVRPATVHPANALSTLDLGRRVRESSGQ